MKICLPVNIIVLFYLTMFDGFTVRTSNNKIPENASMLENSTHPSYNCSENCSFVISPSSLVTAQKSFQKLRNLERQWFYTST